jgi:hypothetical protein
MLFAIYGNSHRDFPLAISKLDYQLRTWMLRPLVENFQHVALVRLAHPVSSADPVSELTDTAPMKMRAASD